MFALQRARTNLVPRSVPLDGTALGIDANIPRGDDVAARESRRRELANVRDFDSLMARYIKPVYNIIFQWIGDHDEAADLTQETFLSAYKALDQFRGDAQIYTWLYRIAHNHCKNRFKQRTRQRKVESISLEAAGALGGDSGEDSSSHAALDVADWSYSPARVLEQKELESLIGRTIDGLAPEYKVVLVLREMEGLTYGEIAEVTGLTMEAVKTRLNRARAMVRQRVEPYYKP